MLGYEYEDVLVSAKSLQDGDVHCSLRLTRTLQNTLFLKLASEAEQSWLRRLRQGGSCGRLPEEDRMLQVDLRPAGWQQGQVTASCPELLFTSTPNPRSVPYLNHNIAAMRRYSTSWTFINVAFGRKNISERNPQSSRLSELILLTSNVCVCVSKEPNVD